LSIIPANITSIPLLMEIKNVFEPSKIVFVIVVIVGTWITAKIFNKLLKSTLSRWMPSDIAKAIIRTVYYTIWGIGIVILLQGLLHISLGNLLVAGGLTGIVVGLAAQTVLSNLFSGLFMYFDRPLRVGDSVELPEFNVSGVVTDIHVISTRIRTWDGLYVRIPNDKLFSTTIKNLMANVARRIEFDIGISYSSDIEKARKIMLDAAHNHPFALAEPPPDVFVKEYGNSAVILSYRVWAPSSVWWSVRTQLLEVIKKRFDEEGIEIPCPQVVNWFRGPLHIVKKEAA
jgi:small-conductance mechanosensitive channel